MDEMICIYLTETTHEQIMCDEVTRTINVRDHSGKDDFDNVTIRYEIYSQFYALMSRLGGN